ncbi:MAG: hypothetical protein WCY05_05235 [Candidatus Omnitrophota bacterium]
MSEPDEYPSAFMELPEVCYDCGARITDDNLLRYCEGCGHSGCMKCLIMPHAAWLCKDSHNKNIVSQECMDEYYLKFGKVIDEVTDKLYDIIESEDLK